jgi:hypothetical protein
MPTTKAAAWKLILADCPWLRKRPLDIAIAEYRAVMREEREHYQGIWEGQTYDSGMEEAN